MPQLSPEQEDELLLRYREGDSDAGGVLVHANAPWIRNIIGKLKCPSWVSQEDLFCDVMPDVLAALRTYSRDKATLKTYLYVAVTRSAVKASRLYEGAISVDDEECFAPDGGVCDVVSTIQGLVAAVPDDEINETGRKLISRMLRGYDMDEIASQMGWEVGETQRMVENMRLFIAYIMVRAGHSADPYITDDVLVSMAEQYEEQKEGWFK